MSVKPGVYVEWVRSNAGRATLDIVQAFEPQRDAFGAPLPFRVSQGQADAVQAALTTIRDVLIHLDLEDNSQAIEARRRQAVTRSKPASAAARSTLY